MKRYITILVLICFLFTITGCNKDKNNTLKEDTDVSIGESVEAEGETVVNKEEDLQALSEKLALQMVDGNFDDTYKRCSYTVKLQLTKDALKQGWDATVDDMGKYISVYEITQREVDGYQNVIVVLEYENNGLKISFTYNDKAKLEGLWINYSPIEEDAVSNDKYEEIKITFGEGDKPVTGILTLPKNVSNPPVAILVPGSGNHDLNETVGANKPFKDLADGLAVNGIASIRYNERAFLYQELNYGEFTIQMDSLDDAADAINYALNSKQIDKTHIYIIGHSLGAMMAPKIASDHPEVTGIALLAGSPRKLEEIVYDQVKAATESSTAMTDSQEKEVISSTEKDMMQIQSLTEGSTDAVLGYPSSYWYSLNQIDIGELAQKLTIPIFIAQGSKDWQVYPDKDYTAWQELLGDKENVTFQLYDNLNHLFMTSNGKSDVTEYNTPGNVDPAVIDDIVLWIKEK